MYTDQIYIARDGKSGMHVLVRILAVDDIGADYPPIDPDNFNKLMMARDVKSLVLAARDLGPMYMSVDSRPGRTFIPSHLQQDIECGFNLVPSDLESLLSIIMRIGGLYRSGVDPDTILEAARFRRMDPTILKKRFNIDTDTCYAIPITFSPFYRMENSVVEDMPFDALQSCPLYGSLIDKKNSFSRTAVEQHLKGCGNEFVKFLAPLETSRIKNRLDNHESHSEESKWRYMVVSSNVDGDAINSQMQLANRLLQAFDGTLFQPQLTYTGVKMAEIAPKRKPSNILEAMWLLVRNHRGYYLLTCKRCMRTVLSGTQGGERSFCSNSCRATWSKEHSAK